MKNIFVILLFTSLMFACGEEGGGDDNPTPPTQTELATRSWKVNKVTVGTATLDVSNYSFSFSANNSFTISAPDVDDPEFPTTGNWVFNSNNQKVILENSVEMDVIRLNEDEFILEYSYQNFKQGTVTFRFEMEPA